MQHLIIGYGYAGFYLAGWLVQNQQQVTTLSREPRAPFIIPGVTHLYQDIRKPLEFNTEQTIIYYLVPPPSSGKKDTLLEQFLALNRLKPVKVIYFSSSGVYGDHQGALINEEAVCHIIYDKQERRLHAEQLWQQFCQQSAIESVMLRVAGIYGPGRLPLTAAKAQTEIIESKAAPYTNHIYVKDLARAAGLLAACQTSGIYNIADGMPTRMGALQEQTAEALGFPKAPYQSFQQAWERSSPAKREFMQASKQLSIQKLLQTLQGSLTISSLKQGIQESLGLL